MAKEMGEKKIESAQAPPSELRHFLLGYPPPLMTSEGKRRDGREEKVSVKLAGFLRVCPALGWRVASYTDP